MKNLEFKVNVVIAPIQESVVIQDTTLNPTLNQDRAGTRRVRAGLTGIFLFRYAYRVEGATKWR